MARRRTSALAILLLAFALSGCYLHRDPGRLRVTIAAPQIPSTLDPHLEERQAARFVHAAIFDSLTTIDRNGEVQPALALSWKPIGPTTWEFKLRQGVTFANGEEFNANTVAYNVRRVLRRELHSPVLKDIPSLFRANPRDLYTVLIQTRQEDPILPRRLAALYMVPVDYVQRIGDEKFAEDPIGTGPWQLSGWSAGSEVVLEARKGAWRATPQSRFVSVQLMTDPAERLRALESGTVNIVLDVPPDQIPTLSQRGYQLQEIPIAAARLVVLDTTADEAPFTDVRIRRALNYAVNKEALLDQVVGAGRALDGQVVGPEANGYSDKVKFTYPYDLAEARRLMTEAGYPNGFQLRIYHSASPDQRERRELQAIANDLSRLNIEVTLRANERGVHLQRRLSGSLSPAYYDEFPYYPTLDAGAVMDYFGLEKTEFMSPTYDHDDFEEIFKLSRTEKNTSLRRQALDISGQILAEFPPAIFLYQPSRIVALQRDVMDFRASPDLLINLDDVSR